MSNWIKTIAHQFGGLDKAQKEDLLNKLQSSTILINKAIDIDNGKSCASHTIGAKIRLTKATHVNHKGIFFAWIIIKDESYSPFYDYQKKTLDLVLIKNRNFSIIISDYKII